MSVKNCHIVNIPPLPLSLKIISLMAGWLLHHKCLNKISYKFKQLLIPNISNVLSLSVVSGCLNNNWLMIINWIVAAIKSYTSPMFKYVALLIRSCSNVSLRISFLSLVGQISICVHFNKWILYASLYSVRIVK